MGNLVEWGIALLVGNTDRNGPLGAALSERFREVSISTSFATTMERFDLAEPIAAVVIDVDSFPGAAHLGMVAAQSCKPSPLVIAIFERPIEAELAFMLGRYGVYRLIEGPITPCQLLELIDNAPRMPLPELSAVVAPYVGRMKLLDFEEKAREAFIDHAIDRAIENRSEAARTLGVTRLVVQRAIAKRAGVTSANGKDPATESRALHENVMLADGE